MKKVISFFLLAIGIFAFNGCSSKEVVTDVSTLSLLDDSNKENIAYNLNLVSKNIKSSSFNGVLEVKGKTYNFNGEVIVNDSTYDSVVHIQYEDNHFYFKKGNFYFSYMYNNTNVIIKDSVDNFVKEIASLLEVKEINCNEEKILEIIRSSNVEDIDFYRISNYVKKVNNGYMIDYKGTVVKLDNRYLPSSLNYSKGDLSLNIEFKYNPVRISVPVGYDLVDINLSKIKELLKVDSFSELLK